MEINHSLISFVARSKRRKDILLMVKDKEKTQAELRKESSMYKSHLSRTLKELVQKKLILCLNPKDRAFKFYKITPIGKLTISKVERILTNIG